MCPGPLRVVPLITLRWSFADDVTSHPLTVNYEGMSGQSQLCAKNYEEREITDEISRSGWSGLEYAAGMVPSTSLTGRLRLYANGSQEFRNSVFGEIFPRLRQIATWKLAKRKCPNAFTPTDLVDEAWLSRLHGGNWKIETHEHFFGIAGQAMQHVLIDLARKQVTERRGSGAIHLSLEELSPGREPAGADAEQVIAIGMLIDKLAKEDAWTAFVVRAHYLAGFELPEIATESGLPLRQVRYRWEKGRVWLATRLKPQRRVNTRTQDRE